MVTVAAPIVRNRNAAMASLILRLSLGKASNVTMVICPEATDVAPIVQMKFVVTAFVIRRRAAMTVTPPVVMVVVETAQLKFAVMACLIAQQKAVTTATQRMAMAAAKIVLQSFAVTGLLNSVSNVTTEIP